MNARRLRRPARSEQGVALVLVLLILIALTFGGVGLATSSKQQMVSVGTEVAKQTALYGADAALTTGRVWFQSQGYTGPPPRANALSITGSSDPSYWNTRNYGGVANASSSDAPNYLLTWAAPDMSLNAGTPGQVRGWFQVAVLPDATVYSSRTLGEEAGRTVRYSYNLRSVATAGGATMAIDQTISQTYGLALYD